MPRARPRRSRHTERTKETSVLRGARQMLALMSADERRRLWLLVPIVILNALVQVVGIASVIPFLGLVASPDAALEQPALRWVYDTFGFGSTTAFLLFVGLGVLVALVLSNGFAAVAQMLILRFSWYLDHTLSVRMLRTYMFKPYVFFLDQNTSGLAKNILGEVRIAVSGFLMAGMNLVARGVVAANVMVLLVVVEPQLAGVTFLFLGVTYGVTFLWIRRGLAQAGRRRSEANRARFKAASEAMTGVKEIKLLGKEQPFVDRYSKPSLRFTRYVVRQQVIRMLPHYVFETIAFGGMLLIVLYFLARGQGVAALLPTLGVYAFAAYRLLPALQGIFGALTDLRFNQYSVELLHADLSRGGTTTFEDRDAVEPLPFVRSLELRSVAFTFPNARKPLFEDFSLRIEPNTTIAFVGSTGAGKTTAIDILLGLLRPEAGALVVDGVAVDDESLIAWQRNLGYVPQEIYLADDTVAANIAFGVPPTKVDMAAVELAARRAHIHDFIVDELPLGYRTEIGERGLRLSGGQRQRLGIARALFHDPAVLILDEATSALDSVTEEHVFRAVHEIGRSKTVIMIAHRISTVRDCDTIYVLEHGRIVAQGDYQELLANSREFRALAHVDSEEVPLAEAG